MLIRGLFKAFNQIEFHIYSIFIVHLFQPDNGREPAGRFGGAIGKEFIRPAARAEPAGLDIFRRNTGSHSTTSFSYNSV